MVLRKISNKGVIVKKLIVLFIIVSLTLVTMAYGSNSQKVTTKAFINNDIQLEIQRLEALSLEIDKL